jgi:quinolinate synthase
MGWELFRKDKDLLPRLQELRHRRNAVLLAHIYERPEVQDVADHVGDSLELSRIAAKTDADVIVFCSVRFMAETAKILSPQKTVLLPVRGAGCPLADFATPEQVLEAKRRHPNAAVVSYVNTSAEVKALSDYCCTSANAPQVVSAIPPGEVLFVPDRHLGKWTAEQTGRELILWDGHCPTHQTIRAKDLVELKRRHPEAEVLVHPECCEEVRALADACMSTAQMLRHCAASPANIFLLGTEIGILHQLEKRVPGKRFLFPGKGPLCPNMKKTFLEDIVASLEEMKHEIVLSPEVIQGAQRALSAMVAAVPVK